MPIKNHTTRGRDELRPEYDLAKLRGGVRGKYYERATAGTTLVLLDPDVAAAFPDGVTVNQALRVLLQAAKANLGNSQGPGSKPALQRAQAGRVKRRS